MKLSGREDWPKVPRLMWETFKRLALGLGLIAAASLLLLLSDLQLRRAPSADHQTQAQRVVRLALLQHASQPTLDRGREGMMQGLAERGWTVGKNLEVKLYNAEGDMTVGQSIAKEMTSGRDDLLMTISTPSLQAVANANKSAHIPLVFGLVADPVAAGALSDRANPLSHPAWMAGYGTMQPVARSFEIAREMNPNLKSVGVVWNAAEANAEAQLKIARKVCADLGITLEEITVENSAGVGEAAAALVSRGVEAIWVPGDVTVITSVDSVIAAGKKAHIPVFSVIPPNVKRGALFDVGADYFEVGRLTGVLAGDVLNGRKTAEIPIVNVMPEMFAVNLQAAQGLAGTWTIPDSLKEKAQLVIDVHGQEHTAAPAATPVPQGNASGKKWKIAFVIYNDSPPTEETLAGMAEAWKKSPLVEGKDYELSIRNAQGDTASLNGIVDAALTDDADMIVPISTPALQVAIQKVRRIPIVFSMIANPMAAGAGKSYTDHLPTVTGVAVMGPASDMLDLLEKYFPTYKHLGTLYCPAETNSVDLKDSFQKMCEKRGFTLDVVAANSPGELPDAAVALANRPIDAIVQISDNLSSAGFTAITKAARQAQKPLISLNSTTAKLGAPVAMGRDYHYSGVVTTEMIEQVIAGADIAKMPFVLPPKVLLTVSPANAKAVGMTLPDDLLKAANKVLP